MTVSRYSWKSALTIISERKKCGSHWWSKLGNLIRYAKSHSIFRREPKVIVVEVRPLIKQSFRGSRLFVWLYVFAVVLTQPLRAESADLQNAVRRPDVLRVKGPPDLHQVINDICWAPRPNLAGLVGPNLILVFPDVPIHSWSSESQYATTLPDLKIASYRGWSESPINNAESHHLRFDAPSISFHDVQRQDWDSVSGETLIKSWRILPHSRELLCQNWKNGLTVCLHDIGETAIGSDGPNHYFFWIESPFFAASKSLKRPKEVAGLVDFADQKRLFAGHLDSNAVGTEISSVRRCQNHNFSGVGSGQKAGEYKPDEWKYMRFAAVGHGGYTYDKATGSSVLLLMNQDIDVSKDGKHWSHIAGPRCFSNAGQLR